MQNGVAGSWVLLITSCGFYESFGLSLTLMTFNDFEGTFPEYIVQCTPSLDIQNFSAIAELDVDVITV